MGHVVRSQGAAWSAHGSASGASRHRLLRRRGQGRWGRRALPRGGRAAVAAAWERQCDATAGVRGHEVLADAGARARDVIGA